MIDRRTVVVTFPISLVTPVRAGAQPSRPMRRIGFLGPPPSAGGLVQAFQRGLRDLGYVEGQNVTIDYRYTDVALLGRVELLDVHATELVRLNPDVLVVSVTEAALAARKGHQHHPDRHGQCARSRGGGTRDEPRSPRRQRDGSVPSDP